MLGAFYMFRTSRVHHQDDHLYCSFLRYVFHTEITIEKFSYFSLYLLYYLPSIAEVDG